eukprot:10503992-Alexandrium_andersonii.AAC.1
MNSDYRPVYRYQDGDLHEFALIRACLGHTCPWVSLERVGRAVDALVLKDLALRQRSDAPLAYYA